MLIEAVGIDLSFQGTRVLKNVDFQLRPGSIHAITGENGAGKSSLAKIIAGLYHPDSGTLTLDGIRTEFRSPREALSRGIALIHQEPMLFPDLSIAENVFAGSLPRKGFGVDWKHVETKTSEILKDLGLGLDPKSLATGLSIADQQMIELAAARVHDIKVWIFDETSAPLTPKEKERLFGIMKKLAADGACVAMVTHHMDEVFSLSNEITVLRDGEKVAYLRTKETSPNEVVRLMVGRSLDEPHREPSSLDGGAAVKVKNLSAAGVEDVSFEIRKGEIFALAGLVGAGRTELTEAIFGIRNIANGSIRLHDQELTTLSLNERINHGVALVPEDRRQHGLFLGHSIEINSTLVHIRKFLSRWNSVLPQKTRGASETLSEQLRVKKTSIDQPVATLSGGNQQKVVLSKWLHEDPKFLILDEPTRGVDVGAKSEVHDLIRALAAKGIPILMVSSDLPEVLALADRIGVMRKGRIVQILNREESTQDTIMRLASG